MPDELSVQVGMAGGPDGAFAVLVIPTWCGAPEEAEGRLAPFLKLGTLLAGTIEPKSPRALLSAFDAMSANGARGFRGTRWLGRLGDGTTEIFLRALETA